MTERDLQRWSREVAENPGAPSFVRLARAYRRQGRADAARDVVLGGLGANPEHVEGHALLALLHVEGGEREQARDEWETVLRLDPGNFDASRGLGFLALERAELDTARRHLDTAARVRPDDPAVRQALQVLERREDAAGAGAGEPERPAGSASAEAARIRTPARGGDPLRIFDGLGGQAPFRGALVLDSQGLILAGRMEAEGRQDDLLGALLNTAVAEAERTVDVLRLGGWQGMLLETEEATLHLAPLEGGAVLVLVTERDAPAGWVVRTANRARTLAVAFLGGGP